MKLITLISTTLLLPAGLMLSVSAQAHSGGPQASQPRGWTRQVIVGVLVRVWREAENL